MDYVCTFGVNYKLMKFISFSCFTLLILSVLACNQNNEARNSKNAALKIKPDRFNVAFLITNGTYNTELTASFDVFQNSQSSKNIKSMNVFTVANTLDPITTFEGLSILPDFDYTKKNLPEIDILVIPGAKAHTNKNLEDVLLLSFVKKVDEKSLYMTSSGNGAFVLAQARLLDTIASTSFPDEIGAYQRMFPNLNIRKNSFFVHDGKYISSAGGSKSFDAALYLCELLYGKEVSQDIAKALLIEWDVNRIPHFIVRQ